MPEGKKDITSYSDFFNKNAPSVPLQAIGILLLGIIAGALAGIAVHYGAFSADAMDVVFSGASAGIFIISIPALLTIFAVKTMRRKMQLKHIMMVTAFISMIYAVFLIADSVLFAVLNNYTVAYVILLLANAAVYGYWFFIEKFVMARKKSAIFTATVQPVINVLFFIPLGAYVLSLDIPVHILLIKLYAGMLVFLAVGYLSLYIVDRPLKKAMNISSAMLFTVMLNQLLYDFSIDMNFLGSDAGAERDIDVDLLVLKGNKKYKAVFVRPDIHYGPFVNVGGSITTEHVGRVISEKYDAAPFVLHGAVNINDNPISTSQVYKLSDSVEERIDSADRFAGASGAIGIGSDGPCRAINIHVGDVSLLTLTKAPLVTEDMERPVGKILEKVASADGSKVILIDAHNSRFERASKKEIEGIHMDSHYVEKYANAIKKSMHMKRGTLKVGVAHQKISALLHYPKDLGGGYTSVCIFDVGGRRFGMVYFDANNIDPKFRSRLLEHLQHVFGFEFELCTTDTHSVNSIALNASNVLGRFSQVEDMKKVVDSMVTVALNDLEPVSYNYRRFVVKNFKVWGEDAEATLTEVGKDVVAKATRTVPFVIVAGFIIAAWIIYII